ncbi:anthranilate synthase component I family protein, partial [Kineococcus glutinatus]|uniref:anthranilate synthase component I family protein n=1 Tax=Kineococcus glutinatus TaxID=1070872 RepID=UPI0031F0A47D
DQRPAPGAPRPAPAGGGDPADRLVLEVRRLDVAVDPEAAFVRLHADAPRAFWLDGATAPARFSYLGAADGPLADVVRHRVGEDPEGVLAVLRRRLARRRPDLSDATGVPPGGLPFGLLGGYVGWLGYEVAAELGFAVTHRAPTPDALWMSAERYVVVDHDAGHTWAVALSTPGERPAARRWLARTCEVLAGLGAAPARRVPQRAREVEVDVEPWLRTDRAGYLAAVAACREALLAGESYEVCLTARAVVPEAALPGGPPSGLEVYRRLRRANPAPHAAYLRCDDVEVACSSPERFLAVDAGGSVTASPIKGTAPRGDTPAGDERLRVELAASPKARAENLMIVDLLRNDLGRVCEVGSVAVPRLMATETYATVHQLVSTITGRLRAGTDALDAVAASFPPGSMTGAPKERTVEIVDALEGAARGVYSGALGWFSGTGAADLAVVIRTLVRTGGTWTTGAGGAVVLDSDPAEEHAEMLLKAAAPLRALLAPAPPAPALRTPPAAASRP